MCHKVVLQKAVIFFRFMLCFHFTVKLPHNGEYCPVEPMKDKSLIPQGPKEFRHSKNFAVFFPKPVSLKTSGQYGNPNRGQFSQL